MSHSKIDSNLHFINPRPEHFAAIQDLCKRVYPFSKPWSIEQLESHQTHFPDGQLIAVDGQTGRVVGVAFSLIISWDDYSHQDSWKDFTSGGFFHNHDPKRGKTLYGAEVIVDPEIRGRGIGKRLYKGRQKIVEKYNLKRIRAGARLRGYSKFADKLSPQEYVREVVERKIFDPTLSFQLNQGFIAIDVAKNYLFNDPESLGYAAVIEWLNPKFASEADFKKQKKRSEDFLSENRYVPEHLPRELRKMVRQTTLILGSLIKEVEGVELYQKIESHRESLKSARKNSPKAPLDDLLQKLSNQQPETLLKIAHAFSLQLELVNVCEAAYRTWRLRQRNLPQSLARKTEMTFVLTSHPTEARSKGVVKLLHEIQDLLVEGLQNNFNLNESKLIGYIRMLWYHPLAKIKAPSVLDEADYTFSLVFQPHVLDFILSDKPNYNLRLRTWVGGDKDGHPGVNEETMTECLFRSRQHLHLALEQKLSVILDDLQLLSASQMTLSQEIIKVRQLQKSFQQLRTITNGDGNRIKKWCIKFEQTIQTSHAFLKEHYQINLIRRSFDLFPALVVPIELRDHATEIRLGIEQKDSPIRKMLLRLKKIAGSLGVEKYAKSLIISHCESAEQIDHAIKLLRLTTDDMRVRIVPLFESRSALINSAKILTSWLQSQKNKDLVRRFWDHKFELMLGYSDSAKEIGVLSSRRLIRSTMRQVEQALKKHQITPIFFHGSGGSVARGGGSVREQIAWWSNSAIANPKMTIQGEMIQRNFSTPEILNSQCVHLSNESLRRKVKTSRHQESAELVKLSKIAESSYQALTQNSEHLAGLLKASPFSYLQMLRIGSRPSKRVQSDPQLDSLRAIPWVLCWTQTRLLFPTWWGVGLAWSSMTDSEKAQLKKLFQVDPFFSSFVKALGFTLAKVELNVWEIYVRELDGPAELIPQFEEEFRLSCKFVKELTGQSQLIWYRPWLEESIRLRAPHIHILNLIQILAMKRQDERLLRETFVGIACGMLTAG